MLRIGLVGCGAIGSQLARTIERSYRASARLVGLYDQDPSKIRQLQRRLHRPPPACVLASLVHRSDLVIEAASVQAAPHVAAAALRAGRDVMVMSVGGLLGDTRWRRLAGRGRVIIPSGALAGLDGIKALAVGTVRQVHLTTRKPPRALAGAPYLERKRIDLSRCRTARMVFEGTARDVVQAFPQNTNVAAALMLASGGVNARTRIRVIADPSVSRNVHELDVTGDCGRIQCRIESRPSSTNPKTSELAVRSAIATLDRLLNPIVIGT